MAKRKKQLNLVIDLLLSKAETLTNEIKLEQGQSESKIELKEQIIDAISNLKLCSDHNIYASNIKIVEIPEGGSEAYFTKFNLVDEAGIKNVPDWAIKKSSNEEVKLNCFDLIIKK